MTKYLSINFYMSWSDAGKTLKFVSQQSQHYWQNKTYKCSGVFKDGFCSQRAVNRKSPMLFSIVHWQKVTGFCPYFKFLLQLQTIRSLLMHETNSPKSPSSLITV